MTVGEKLDRKRAQYKRMLKKLKAFEIEASTQLKESNELNEEQKKRIEYLEGECDNNKDLIDILSTSLKVGEKRRQREMDESNDQTARIARNLQNTASRYYVLRTETSEQQSRLSRLTEDFAAQRASIDLLRAQLRVCGVDPIA